MQRSGIREIMDMGWSVPDLVHLEVGEPDFETPAHIVDAASRAASRGQTRYTPNIGIGPLREALSDKIYRINGYAAHPDNVVVSQGAVQGIFNALASTLQMGDEVLIPDPGWPNYRMMATILGARAVGYRLASESDSQPDPGQLRDLVTSRTRVIIVNSPSNPLGTVLTAETLHMILDIAAQHDLWVISDECYDQIVFEGESLSTAAIEEHAERIITAYSFSKTYAMTGWRVGYVVAPTELVQIMAKVQEPLVSCINAPAQHAALAAISGPQDFVDDSVQTYRSRRDSVCGWLDDAGIGYARPTGAFYLWLFIGNDRLDGTEVARRLVTDFGVAVAPGPTFGESAGSSVRLSLANSLDNLRLGIDRVIDSGLISSSVSPPSVAPPC